jgi:hypothetical protein
MQHEAHISIDLPQADTVPVCTVDSTDAPLTPSPPSSDDDDDTESYDDTSTPQWILGGSNKVILYARLPPSHLEGSVSSLRPMSAWAMILEPNTSPVHITLVTCSGQHCSEYEVRIKPVKSRNFLKINIKCLGKPAIKRPGLVYRLAFHNKNDIGDVRYTPFVKFLSACASQL